MEELVREREMCRLKRSGTGIPKGAGGTGNLGAE